MSKRFNGLWAAALALGTLWSGAPARANPAMDAQVRQINDQWAQIRYRSGGKADQFTLFEQLEKQAAAVSARFPNQPEPLLWQGIIVSEEARTASMFSRMSYAKQARDLLVHAYQINPRAADGGVAMSLGVLFYRVPGFPIGFGNVKKAEAFLKQALQLNPNGLDANFFYADYLVQQGNKAGAKPYLLKALAAPADPARPVWDAGRRGEVRALLAQIR